LEKPLVWAGNGIRLDGEVKRFRTFVEESYIPVVTTWTGADLLPTDHPLNVGIVGVSGHAGANKAVHEADILLVRGSGRHNTQLGPKPPNNESYALDYDEWPDVGGDWIERCQELKKEKVPLIGSYLFNDKMTRLLPPGCNIVIDGGGTALYTGFQSSHVKEGTRLICSTAISAMGSGLPEAIGACLARSGRITTCLIGDGSLMFNLQELSTIKHLNLPIKIFVLNNGGYLAIRHTQDSFLEGRYHGTGKEDLSIPWLSSVAYCFRLRYETEVEAALAGDDPVLCEVFTPVDQPKGMVL
jgi:acetolactate synthase-1/2/3 large subunit